MTPRSFSIRQHITAPASATRDGNDTQRSARPARQSTAPAFGVGTPYQSSSSLGSKALMIIAVGGAMIALL